MIAFLKLFFELLDLSVIKRQLIEFWFAIRTEFSIIF